ncbi:hypothetical protein C8R45DRAFT_1206681 [Mycena sanguinolenta]|nr:hypothetical protein C8R45DRAFT_1206681 [Mycena sanguinolenta]
MLVQSRLDSYKYPVLTVPNEMVSEFFVHTLPPYPLCPALFGKTSPTSLTHICHKWRQIALATSELWRAIRVSDLFPLHRPISEVWAKRSGSFPLSIHMGIERSQGIYPELLDRRARWEHLTLNVYKRAIPNIDGPMPLLRHLELAQCDDTGSFELRDAPQLRSVVLRYLWAVVLPWQQLTHLTIDHTDHFLPILQQTKTSPHIALPFLETFVFNISPEKLGTQFFDLVTTPALHSLTVSEKCLGLDPVTFLTSFFAKSHCWLQILGITGRRGLIQSTYRTAFPSITKLVFKRSYFEVSSDEEDSLVVLDKAHRNAYPPMRPPIQYT